MSILREGHRKNIRERFRWKVPCLTEELIRQAGGTGYGIRCDHTKDDETKAVIDRIISEHKKIDILVNSVWGGYEYLRTAQNLERKGVLGCSGRAV